MEDFNFLSLKTLFTQVQRTTPRDCPGELVLFPPVGELALVSTPYIVSSCNGDMIEGLPKICELGKADED